MGLFHKRLLVVLYKKLGTSVALLTIISIWIFLAYKTQVIHFWNRASLVTKSTNLEDSRTSFLEAWCRVEELTRDWRRVLSPCRGNVTWRENVPVWNPKSTDPGTSFITVWDIRPAGQFSRIVIQTQSRDGTLKRIGGDAWRVHFTGPASFAPTVIDCENGTYEIMFLAMEHGKYQMEVMLDYTLCDGLRDPPKDWFVKGNAQGKDQPQGILGNDSPYILQPLWGGPGTIEVNVPPGTKDHALIADAMRKCSMPCKRLWNGRGRWVNGAWTPYLTEKPYTRWPRSKTGLFWVYGDSMAMALFNSLRKRKLCKELFKRCGYSYNWVYQMNNYNLTLHEFVKKPLALAKKENDDLDFNVQRVLNEISQVLFHPEMNENGVVLLNLGLHYVENTNFTNYKTLIDGLVKLLQEGKTVEIDGKVVTRNFEGRLIWKSITAINRQKYIANHLDSRRFLTYQRVELFNTYAMDTLCTAGYDVIDVYPLTDSYPEGTGRPDTPTDAVHYRECVFESMEELLEKYFSSPS